MHRKQQVHERRQDCHAPNEHAGTRTEASFLLDRIERALPVPGRLLDFCAGGGWLLQSARERGWQVVGYDVGSRSLAACRARGLEVTDRLETLPRGAFDAIVLHHVLEHLSEPAQMLLELCRLLSARGKLFIEVPNVQSLRARLSLPVLSRYASIDERYRAFSYPPLLLRSALTPPHRRRSAPTRTRFRFEYFIEQHPNPYSKSTSLWLD
jgi:2-polyprenyl-3-methyl-5-hydroxy-6-metoxy-1,4-benzoquinol methylase